MLFNFISGEFPDFRLGMKVESLYNSLLIINKYGREKQNEKLPSMLVGIQKITLPCKKMDIDFLLDL